jgi:hypothetical protein
MGRIGDRHPFRGRFRGEYRRVGTVDDFDAVLFHKTYSSFPASALEVHFPRGRVVRPLIQKSITKTQNY